MSENIDKQSDPETETKLEIHNTSTVYVISDEQNPRALLIKHRKLSVWLPPGGHQNKNESVYDAAIRETQEETGIDIRDYLGNPLRIDNQSVSLPVPRYILLEDIPEHGDDPAHIHQDSIFVARIPHQEAVNSDRESVDIKWFGREEIEELEMFKNAKDLLVEVFDSFDETNKNGVGS